MVTLLDGRIVAVDEASGRVMWTFDSGTPLVSVKQSQVVAAGLSIFPGVDGGLYAYGSTVGADGAIGTSKLEVGGSCVRPWAACHGACLGAWRSSACTHGAQSPKPQPNCCVPMQTAGRWTEGWRGVSCDCHEH